MPLTKLKYTGDTLTAEKGSKRVHVHTYFGLADDSLMTTVEVRDDPLMPRELDIDPYDQFARIVSISCKRRGQHQLRTWDITITSTTEIDDNPNPLQAPAKWSARSVLYEYPAVKDADNKWIQNTAGDLIEGAMRTVVGKTFTARCSIPDAPIRWIDAFEDTVNDAPITIRGKRCAEKTVWFREFDIGEPEKQYGVTHCPSSFVMEYNPRGWEYRPLNMGFRELKITRTRVPKSSASGVGRPRYVTKKELLEITDAAGRPISEKVFLNRDGSQYRVDDGTGKMILKAPLDAADIVELRFRIKSTASFRQLGIFRSG